MEKTVCPDTEDSDCPFAFTENSEWVQCYGCLPSPKEIIDMRLIKGKTWACHSDPSKPCKGAINYLKENNLPHTVIDSELVTEHNFHNYI